MQPLTGTTLLAQIAPQRSTQYAALASELAPAELTLSPLGPHIQSMRPRTLGNQSYLQVELANLPEQGLLDEATLSMLGSLAMTTAYFVLHHHVGGVDGPFLQPIETTFLAQQPSELITARRYRGKTNELFTHWLCNIAKFSSDFATTPWDSLTLMDPLAGGGTTLFTGLVLGAQTVAGIELEQKEGKSTATFLKQFADESRIPARLKEERLKKLGRRWTISLGEAPELHAARNQLSRDTQIKNEQNGDEQNRKDALARSKARNSADRQSFIWTQGSTVQARDLLPSFKPHLIVTDLPYGIQHQGQLISLLDQALPVWSAMLRRGGAMALAWDATRFPASQMHSSLEKYNMLTILREPPYDQLQHRVDRVIKQRDVVVLRF